MNCLNCQQETSNPKFCSRSCAAIFNNKEFPKRNRKKRKCSKCDNFISHHGTTLCVQHGEEYNISRKRERTLGEYKNSEAVKGKHRSAVYVQIRQFARGWLKHLTQLPCAHCGYEKHVELAHIKAISTYSDDTPLSIINSPDNVIQLCPNCHWEFDNLSRNNLVESGGIDPPSTPYKEDALPLS